MRRKLSLVIAFIGVLGLIGFAPTAEATHDGGNGNKNDGKHEAIPVPPVPGQVGGVCTVAGDVIIGDSSGIGGVDADSKNHNHYEFVGTQINCNNLPIGDDLSDFEGDFDVEATGGTDGEGDPSQTGDNNPLAHGENDLLGWSHQDGYHDVKDTVHATHKSGEPIQSLYAGTSLLGTPNDCANCGEILVTALSGQKSSDNIPGPASDNAVLFLRAGTTVEAWGILHPNNGKGAVCFLAELEFIPEPKIGEKVNTAELAGAAQLWLGNKADCGINQGENKK